MTSVIIKISVPRTIILNKIMAARTIAPLHGTQKTTGDTNEQNSFQ